MNPIVEKVRQFGLDQALQISSIFKTEVILKKNDIWLKENTVCEHQGFITEGMCRYFYINGNGDEVTRWVSIENEFTISLGSFLRKIRTREDVQAAVRPKCWLPKRKSGKLFVKTTSLPVFLARTLEGYLIFGSNNDKPDLHKKNIISHDFQAR